MNKNLKLYVIAPAIAGILWVLYNIVYVYANHGFGRERLYYQWLLIDFAFAFIIMVLSNRIAQLFKGD